MLAELPILLLVQLLPEEVVLSEPRLLRQTVMEQAAQMPLA